MLGLAIGFFIAAIIAAIFGFGVVATTFAGLAQLLFYVFLVLVVVSLVLHLLGAHSATSGLAGGAGLLVVGALVAVATYAWFDNGMSAERLGRAIDRGATQLRVDAGDALDSAGHRARQLASSTGDSVRHDAARLIDDDRNGSSER